MTQGRFATLGWRTQSLRDCRNARIGFDANACAKSCRRTSRRAIAWRDSIPPPPRRLGRRISFGRWLQAWAKGIRSGEWRSEEWERICSVFIPPDRHSPDLRCFFHNFRVFHGCESCSARSDCLAGFHCGAAPHAGQEIFFGRWLHACALVRGMSVRGIKSTRNPVLFL